MDDEDRRNWLMRFLSLMQENPHAEVTILGNDELTLSYGPNLNDEVEIGDRRKINLANLEAHVEAIDERDV